MDWVGTDEVVQGYGGSETLNPSFLPRRNPEVMYFALGQVSDANVHSLFDRKTDTAIDFPEDTTRVKREQRAGCGPPRDQAVQVPGNTLVRLIPDYYTKTLGLPYYVPFDDTHFSGRRWSGAVGLAMTGGHAEDIIRKADWIADHSSPMVRVRCTG